MSLFDPFANAVFGHIYNPTVYVDNTGLPSNEVSNTLVLKQARRWYLYLAFVWGVGEGPTGGERFPNFDFTILRRRSISEGWLDTDLTFQWNPDNGNFGTWGVKVDADALPALERSPIFNRNDWALRRTASGGNGTWTLRTSVFALGFNHPGHRDKEAFSFLPGARPLRLLAEFPSADGNNIGSLV